MSDLISDYDYELPESLIAQTPTEPRDASRLLHLDRGTGEVAHRHFRDILGLLRPGDLLVRNNTRVSAMRLHGSRRTGGAVELLLMREVEPGTFEALAKPAKRLTPGVEIDFGSGIVGEVVAGAPSGFRWVRFSDEALARLPEIAEPPLPPYIREKLVDPGRYQTVYAQTGGSSAAPTAGLHFTSTMLSELEAMGVRTAEVTLDVGLDTFRPVMVDDLDVHVMHGERCTVPPETSAAIARAEGRIVAVGTTTVRTLETHAIGPRQVSAGSAVSRLFIRPGYQFKAIDGMFTNFHMPRTTMMMMISALAGREAILRAYQIAVTERYRFLSFGDSMLIV